MPPVDRTDRTKKPALVPLASVQGDTILPALDAVAVAKQQLQQWLPAVEAPAIDETAPGDAIADAVRDIVNNSTAQTIESTVFNVVQAIADAVQDGTESEADDQDDNEDKSPQRKKKIARKRERTPEETQPMSPEANATPSTPDPDESQKVDDDCDDRVIMSPCKKPKSTPEKHEEQGKMVPALVQM